MSKALDDAAKSLEAAENAISSAIQAAKERFERFDLKFDGFTRREVASIAGGELDKILYDLDAAASAVQEATAALGDYEEPEAA